MLHAYAFAYASAQASAYASCFLRTCCSMLKARFYVLLHGKGQDLGPEWLNDERMCMDDEDESPVWIRISSNAG